MSEQELQKIKEATQKDIEEYARRNEVVLKRKRTRIIKCQMYNKVEILEERMVLESQKLFEQMQSQIEEQQALLEAQLVQAQTRTKQVVMEKDQFDNLDERWRI